MILTFEDLIINIFVKIDDFYKITIFLINKQYFIKYINCDNDNNKNKKRIYKSTIDTLSEEDKKTFK